MGEMKDGRTRRVCNAQHAVDLESGTLVGVTVQGADLGDTKIVPQTLEAVDEPQARCRRTWCWARAVHSQKTLERVEKVRSEPKRKARNWSGSAAASRTQLA